jgi:DNA-binding GntR family transcriptional regulator
MAARVGQPSPVTGEGAVFRLLRSRNAFEETVERLLQAVRQGVVNPGERLPAERELAVRLGVSRVTLREAIGSLREAGYLSARRGRGGGTFVVARPPPRLGMARPGPRDLVALDDMLALRLVLECGAAELAAARRLTPPARRRAAQTDHGGREVYARRLPPRGLPAAPGHRGAERLAVLGRSGRRCQGTHQ